MGKYDVNFLQLIKESLPVSVRGTLVEWIYVLIKPILVVYNRFKDLKTDNENKLSYNAQYPNLQRLLNDKLDSILRRIKVKDGDETIDELLVFPNEEIKPIHLGEPEELVLIYPSSRWGYEPFTVLVPELQENGEEFKKIENRIKRLLDIYKFLGTQYKIEYYE